MAGNRELAIDALRVPGYVVGERLGAGGFGEVYRARHEVIGREVAIKILHARYSEDLTAVKRFVDEARAVNQIPHPNIVQISDFGRLSDGRQFCVMELIEGTTLRALLRERGRLSLAEALPILRGVAEAVEAAHAVGIVHRDLKPDNVFVLPDGRVKLIDFGLAKLTHEQSTAVTQTGEVFGTPLYMSPEQCRGNAITAATDAYSFGAVAYHVLVGEPPFAGEPLELALHHIHDDPPPPSSKRDELDAKVDRVVLALMAKNPADRPTSLVTALDALVGEAALPRVRRRFPRRLALGVGGVVLAGGAIAGVFAMGGDDAPARACPLAADKLAGVWDEHVKRELKARFDAVQRVDVQATWTRVSDDMDTMIAAWASRWEESCTGDERVRDPLLWAQRQACLESTLPAVRREMNTLRRVDVSTFSQGFPFDFVAWKMGTARNCTSEPILRATPPPLPVAARERVLVLEEELRNLRNVYRKAFLAKDQVESERQVARMQAIEAEMHELGVKGFYELNWRTLFLVENAEGDSSLVPAARDALKAGIRQAELAFDDRALGHYHGLVAALERAANSPAAVVEDAIEKKAAATGRIGSDPSANADVIGLRAGLAARDGNFEEAIRLTRAIVVEDTDVYMALPFPDRLSDWSARLGRFDDAIALRKLDVDHYVLKLGPVHEQVTDARWPYAFLLADAGRFDEAVAELETIEDIYRKIGLEDRLPGIQRDKLEVLARAGRSIDGTFDDWSQIATNALARGDVALAARGLDEMARLAHERRAELAPSRVYVAFARGDLDEMRARSREIVASDASIGPWWDAVVAAYTGDAPRQVPPAPPATEPTTAFLGGVVALRAGRAKDAVRAFETSRSALPPVRDFKMAEADAFLGWARVEAGDHAGAIAPLEESLAILANCCYGRHYFAPIAALALARALGATGGDASRAKALTESAREGFARVGGSWAEMAEAS